jgi:hypothetical protein
VDLINRQLRPAILFAGSFSFTTKERRGMKYHGVFLRACDSLCLGFSSSPAEQPFVYKYPRAHGYPIPKSEADEAIGEIPDEPASELFPTHAIFFYKYPVIVHHIHPEGDGYQNQQDEVDPEGFFEKGGHVIATKLMVRFISI